jgi:Xylose isomerase-like TIM barrel
MSIAGGLWQALERGHALGCGAVQIFLKNQRQWAAPLLTPDDVRAFLAARQRTGIACVFAHASYLINLASPGPEEWARAVDVFTDELERGEALGLACLVIHPGSHRGAGVEAGLTRVAAALDEATHRTAGYCWRRRDAGSAVRRARRPVPTRGAAGAPRRMHRHLPSLHGGLRHPGGAGVGSGRGRMRRAGRARTRPGLSSQRRPGRTGVGTRPSRAHRAGCARRRRLPPPAHRPSLCRRAQGAGDAEGAGAGGRPAQPGPAARPSR